MIKATHLAIGALALLAVPLVSLGCGTTGQAPTTAAVEESAFAVLHDDDGRTVTLKEKPRRIVVTSASFLEPLHEVGGDVVGRPDSRLKMPDYAKDKASIGAVYQIDTEKLMACQPDFVILNKGMNEKLLQALEASNVPAIVINMKTYDDVKRTLRLLAQVTGEEARGEELMADMDKRIRDIKQSLPAEKKRVAILHSTAQGLSVQLDSSIAGSVAKILGFENVASGMAPLESNPDAAPYSLETLVEQDPEIIFVTSMGKLDEIKSNMDQTIAANPAWQSLPAIQKNQLYYLPQDYFLLSPGLHYPEAVALMAKLVYPEAVP